MNVLANAPGRKAGITKRNFVAVCKLYYKTATYLWQVSVWIFESATLNAATDFFAAAVILSGD